jgi:hypothetical protein
LAFGVLVRVTFIDEYSNMFLKTGSAPPLARSAIRCRHHSGDAVLRSGLSLSSCLARLRVFGLVKRPRTSVKFASPVSNQSPRALSKLIVLALSSVARFSCSGVSADFFPLCSFLAFLSVLGTGFGGFSAGPAAPLARSASRLRHHNDGAFLSSGLPCPSSLLEPH